MVVDAGITRTLISPNKHNGRLETIKYIVLHTTENDEKTGVAWNVANYFNKPGTKASSHVVIDNADVIRVVEDRDTAWAAPGANAAGLQIELVGRAAQTGEQWADEYSTAQLNRAAQLAAYWCYIYQIPVHHLTVEELKAGKTKGFIGHADATNAFKKSTHTDPGTDFPWAVFLNKVQAHLSGHPSTAPKPAPQPNQPDTLPPINSAAPKGATTVTKLTVDGDWGPATTRRFQEVLGTTIDAQISGQIKCAANTNLRTATWEGTGSKSIKALQTKLGILKPDGLLGPNTVQLWQIKLHVKETRILDANTIKAIQTALNAGRVF